MDIMLLLRNHCETALDTESDDFLVSFGGQLATHCSAGNLLLWKQQWVLNDLGFKEVERKILCRSQRLVLHHCILDLDQDAYSQFLIERKTLELEGVSLLQKSRFGCKNKYLFHFQICDFKCPGNNILKTLSCPGKKKHRTGASWEY